MPPVSAAPEPDSSGSKVVAPATAPSAPAPTANAPDPTTPDEAIELLEELEDQLTADPPAPSGRAPVDPIDRGENDLTIPLLQLAMSQDLLPPAKRRDAQRILARPSDGAKADEHGYKFPKDRATDCSGPLCVHWATNPKDPHYTAPASGSDYTDQVVASTSVVYDKYIEMGYRKPIADQGGDGTAKPDIYLASLGSSGLYGYCTTDDPKVASGSVSRGTYGYCVYDNDFLDPEYGDDFTPLESLQVTAAHEYFHLLQFGYDFGEDRWLMEATATWAEDQVYPDVNNSVIYFDESPLRLPQLPLDFSDVQYGSWVFFQYLSQRFGAELVRTIWERADAWRAWGTRKPRNEYSLQAVRGAVARQASWNDVWRRFADHNRRPSLFYADAKSGEVNYPGSRPRVWKTLSWRTKNDRRALRVFHLTAATLRYKPAKGTGSWRMKVSVDGLRRAYGGSGIATFMGSDGRIRRVPFDFNGDGTITKWLPFGTAKVKWVDITIVNASTRYRCKTQSVDADTTCQGTPRDDNAVFEVRVNINKK